jgi:hypothetical protein
VRGGQVIVIDSGLIAALDTTTESTPSSPRSRSTSPSKKARLATLSA